MLLRRRRLVAVLEVIATEVLATPRSAAVLDVNVASGKLSTV
jgi:hypothetical protein